MSQAGVNVILVIKAELKIVHAKENNYRTSLHTKNGSFGDKKYQESFQSLLNALSS